MYAKGRHQGTRQSGGTRTSCLNFYLKDRSKDLSFRLTFESTQKSENKGRLHGQKNIFLVHDMTLLPVLHNSAFLNALECKGAIRDTLCSVLNNFDIILKSERLRALVPLSRKFLFKILTLP